MEPACLHFVSTTEPGQPTPSLTKEHLFSNRLCVVVPLLAVRCTCRVKKRCCVCWLACCGLNITGVCTETVEFLMYGQQPARLGWGSNKLTISGVFSFHTFSCFPLDVHAGALLKVLNLNSASNLFA